MKDFDSLRNLQRPQGKVRLVIDTDAYNEIDDQFSISYALKSPDEVSLEALYAAPFFNSKSEGPEDGMEKSYDEILKLLSLAGRNDLTPFVFKGSRSYLADEQTPVESPAVDDLIARAKTASPEEPLYVVALGAITNVSSALIKAPEIGKNLVVVWLGGHAWHWPDTKEFNMMQDVAAARVLFDSDAALVQLPCMGVVDHCAVTKPELEYWLKGKNPLADYLAENTIQEAESYAAGKAWSRVIWDITPMGWILDRTENILQDRVDYRPIPEYDHHYGFDCRRKLMKYVWNINRDALFTDLFDRLTR